jgi:hypothetical protein
MKFRTTILQGNGTTTGIHVPDTVVEALGAGKKPKVKVTLNGHTYRSSIASMGGRFMVGVSAEVRAAAGVSGGDELGVEIVLDTEPREVAVPDDLVAALAADPAAKAKFEALSYSHQRRHVMAIDAAKGPETRARRVAGTMAALQGG